MNLLYRNIFFFISLLMTIAFGRDLVLLGFNGQGAPSAEKTYDRILREHLAVTPDIQLVDLTQSQRLKSYINFDTHDILSKELIESLGKYVKDTTYFAWGTVREFKVSPKRKFFFKAQLKGELTVDLNLYNYMEHTIPYSGTIKAVIYQDKGLIFFSPISRTIHVSALEQTEILEKVEYEAVRKTCQMIAATVHSELARTGANKDEANSTAKAINEVLTTPRVEAPEIAKSAIISDTTAKSTKTDTTTAGAQEKSSTQVQSNK